ncbi:hypothetical protein WA026_009068, partial [Henosepilachna vigintioctopunctata]
MSDEDEWIGIAWIRSINHSNTRSRMQHPTNQKKQIDPVLSDCDLGAKRILPDCIGIRTDTLLITIDSMDSIYIRLDVFVAAGGTIQEGTLLTAYDVCFISVAATDKDLGADCD